MVSSPASAASWWSATLTVAGVTFRDCIRRGSVLALVALVAAMMVSLRYFVVFGFGEETRLLQELGLSNLLLGGALLAALCAAPVAKSGAIRAADLVVQTRPVPAMVLPLGRWVGILMVVLCADLLWSLLLAGSLAWFASAERGIFLMNGPTTVSGELSRMVLPALLVFGHSMLMGAVAVAASVRAGFVATLVAVGIAMVVGVMIPGFVSESAGGAGGVVEAVVGAVIPDLRLLLPGNTLYPDRLPTGWLTGAAIQTMAVCGLLMLVAAWRIRARE
jgi:hypothetical protein